MTREHIHVDLSGGAEPFTYDESGHRLAIQPAKGEQLRTATAPMLHFAAGLGVVVGMLGMVLVVVIVKVVGA